MNISYISDLHMDFHAPFHKNQTKWKDRTTAFTLQLIESDQTERKVLIVAGDLSHYNKQSYWMLETFSQAYESVFFTIGNHDFYLVSNSQESKYKNHSLNRMNELLKMVNDLENVTTLLGFEKHHINDEITIAGDTFWYPIETLEQIAFFHNRSHDSRYIKGMNIGLEHNYSSVYYNKLDAATIIVTHIPPITTNSHYKYNSATCYLNPISELKSTHWVFGHCHEQSVYTKPYGNFYINAIGYKDEYKSWYSNDVVFSLEQSHQIYNDWYSIKSFVV